MQPSFNSPKSNGFSDSNSLAGRLRRNRIQPGLSLDENEISRRLEAPRSSRAPCMKSTNPCHWRRSDLLPLH